MTQENQSQIAQHHYFWLDIIRILLGCVLVTEFYSLFSQGFFTAAGFENRLQQILNYNSTPGWHFILNWFAATSSIFAPLIAIVLALTSIAMIFLVAKRFTSWLTVIIFLFFYLSHLHYPGTWLFEYLMPLLVSICVAIASLSPLAENKTWQQPRWWLQIIILLLVACLLWYVIFLSLNRNQAVYFVATWSAASVAILLFISIILDRFRKNKIQTSSVNKVTRIAWMDIITILVGAMLVFQVNEDTLNHWFTITGYRSLIEIYQVHSHAPDWFVFFLKLAQDNANFEMPIQLEVESMCALLLDILVLRIPFTIIAFLLFAMLSYTEFGVPATVHFSPQAGDTWTWELLFTACVTFFIVIFNIQRLFILKPNKRFHLGTNVFGNTHIILRIIIAIAGGVILAFFVFINGSLSRYTELLTIESGLTFFFYLLLLAIIDYNRPANNLSNE